MIFKGFTTHKAIHKFDQNNYLRAGTVDSSGSLIINAIPPSGFYDSSVLVLDETEQRDSSIYVTVVTPSPRKLRFWFFDAVDLSKFHDTECI